MATTQIQPRLTQEIVDGEKLPSRTSTRKNNSLGPSPANESLEIQSRLHDDL